MRQFLVSLALAFALCGCASQEPVSASEEAAKPQETVSERAPLEFGVVSQLGFDETVEKIKEVAAAEKYGVQGVHAISDILTEKGFPRDRLTIVEVCNPAAAATTLNNDLRAGLHMPCPIMVYEQDGQVKVMTFDTRTMAKMYEGVDMAATGDSVYTVLKKILDSVAVSPR